MKRKRRSTVPTHELRTLLPHRLAEMQQPIYDISGYLSPRFQVSMLESKTLPFRLRYLSSMLDVPFPEGTRGFLYFKHMPNLRSEVRWRVCEDHGAFDGGHDLALPFGAAWSIPLIKIFNSKKYFALRSLIFRDGLVDSQTVALLARVTPNKDEVILFDIFDPFVVDFLDICVNILLFKRNLIARGSIYHVFSEAALIERAKNYAVYSGKALVQFERCQDYNGDEALCLRFLEFLTPIKCTKPDYDTSVQPPVVGALLQKRNSSDLPYQPWIFTLKFSAFGRAIANILRISV
ncbi:hypothetical protein JR316_0010367 [Psilocybe cubensis]|uniref:Uncharacterized protein n=2 Tax=Psilocybe cubensis TaxID=181762 RepID=A0A8H7XJY2_PSICU|nr:hypothetical protein JR316_0010367 [Psilocybe cubensis]KAH9476455.1 hypothetical protein JR316_0010367 [Psilocybe cubensis]